MSVINKISDFGNSFFDWVIKGIIPLPGIIKGLIVLVILALVIIGVFTLLRKSLKVFGILLSLFFIVILVCILLSK